MFVGFDFQNTSHFFPHYHNWSLWVLGFFGFGSEVIQRISRGDNCERFVHFFVFFFSETKAGMIKKENNAL